MEFKGTKMLSVHYHTTKNLPYKYTVSDVQETEEEVKANALLILKAPEMLEMLKRLIQPGLDISDLIQAEQLIKEATDI